MKFNKVLLIIIPLLIFVLVISVNFFKPFGFFRESNPAMVCINADYWNKNPLLKQHHIPIESYSFNPKEKPQTQMWSTVTSFGYGWFLVPYLFFSIFHLLPGEISVRIFSLLWLAFTLLGVYLLCRRLAKSMLRPLAVTYYTMILYVFSASILWYHVQGYVHEIAVLPFYFLSWYFFLRFIEEPKFKWLLLTSLFIFVSVQFDWLPCFQAGVITIYLFVHRGRLQNRFAFLLPAMSIALGVGWIIYTYSQWATLQVYLDFLKEKFITRSVGSGGLQLINGVNFNFNLLIFYAMGFGLLCLFFLWSLTKRKPPLIVWLMIISASLHHIIFWGFSTEHDHAVIKMAFPIAFLASSMISSYKLSRRIAVIALLVVSNISLYFFLHNFYKREGMYTNPNFCYETGTFMRKRFSNSYQHVFINTQGKYLLQIEFYAGKPYTRASSLEEAKQILHVEHPGELGYFMDGQKDINTIISFK